VPSQRLFLYVFASRQKPQAAKRNHGRKKQNDPHGVIPRSKPATMQAPQWQGANLNVAEVGRPKYRQHRAAQRTEGRSTKRTARGPAQRNDATKAAADNIADPRGDVGEGGR
jgi:hypothetical protein